MTGDLSVIVPLYDEEDSVRELYEALIAAVGPLRFDHEFVFVDDGSRDGTFAAALALAKEDPLLKVVKLRRNFGQTQALAAGFDHARGRILVTIDGDLQNDPADIPRLLEKIAEGYDVVCGWRRNRKDRALTRYLPSLLANRLIAAATGVRVRDNGCTLRAYRAEAAGKISLYSDTHRFMPALAALAGGRIAEVVVNHRARKHGRSKYGLSRIYKVAVDLLAVRMTAAFASRPLRTFGTAAAVPGLFCLGGLAWSAGVVAAGGRESIVVVLGAAALMGALATFLAMAGMLGELIYRSGGSKMPVLAKTDSMICGAGTASRSEGT